MSLDYLKYLNSPLKSKVQDLLQPSSSLNNDEKSIIVEILNYFTTKFDKLQNDYNQLLSRNEFTTGNNKKRSFNTLTSDAQGDSGSDQMLIDSDEPKALSTHKYSNFVSLPQPQKPKFNASFYSIKNIIHDVSFMNPRRTYHVVITEDAFIIIYPNGNYIELIIPFSYILEIICVTIPETTSKQWCFSLVVDSVYNSYTNSSNANSNQHEIFIFKFNDNKNLKVYEPPNGDVETSQLDTFGFQPVTTSPTNKDYLISLLKNYVWPHRSKTVIEPDVATFVSKKKTMSSHSKGKSHKFHINCYYKAKEGYLFLLKEGIFYGAKKPSLYFPMSAILSIKVTNVTSRTFNLNIRRRQFPTTVNSSTTPSNKKLKSEKGIGSTKSNDDSSMEEENFEFSMIDSVEFDAIMEYIRQHKTEWSTNRNGEFGMNTEEAEESEQAEQHPDEEDGDDDDGDSKEGKKKKNSNKNGENQNIFTFVDEDESNDEDYHPDMDSDTGDSSEDDSDVMDKDQIEKDIKNDKKLLKSMNKGEFEDDEEEDIEDEEEDIEEEDDDNDEDNNKKEKEKEKEKETKTKGKRTRKTTTKSSTTSEKKKKSENKRGKKAISTSTSTSTMNQQEDVVMKDNNLMSDTDADINEISSNVEDISLTKSPTKRSKRKASNPKKLSSKVKTPSTKATKKRASTIKSTNSSSNNNNTNTNINANDSGHQDTKMITSPKPKNQTKQLTMYDIFNKKPSTSKNQTKSKTEEEKDKVVVIEEENEAQEEVQEENKITMTTTMEQEEEDDDDEEDEILFE